MGQNATYSTSMGLQWEFGADYNWTREVFLRIFAQPVVKLKETV